MAYYGAADRGAVVVARSDVPTAQEVERIARRLESLQRRRTCYEIVVRLTGHSYLVGYLPVCSRSRLIEALRADARLLGAVCDALDPNGLSAYTAAGGWRFPARDGGTITLGRSGRTEREAVIDGELSRYGS